MVLKFLPKDQSLHTVVVGQQGNLREEGGGQRLHLRGNGKLMVVVVRLNEIMEIVELEELR